MRSSTVAANQTGFVSQYNDLRHDARGGSFLLPHQLLGALALGTAPTNGQTITFVVNGNSIVLTAVTGTPTNPGDVKAPGTAAAFAANVFALLSQPQTTTANAVALSAIYQQYLSYLSFGLVGTTLTISSNNTSVYAPLSSFTASTTVTSGTWTAQTMQLYVEPGVIYVNGTRVVFSGASTPTVTAPVSNPRIDVLTVDNTGTLAWTTGTEASSPVAPTYPANKIALCELYNVVGETALYDIENQQNGQGYVYHDVRPVLSYSVPLSAIPDDLLPDADGTRNLGSASFEWGTIYAKNGILINGAGIPSAQFGGNGTDGALTQTSGTTTVSAAGASVFTKNYASISISGTAYVQFTTPNSAGTLIYLRSQGNVTLTSSATPMLDASGMGGAGGASVSSLGNGNPGTSGQIVLDSGGHGGSAGASLSSATGGSALTNTAFYARVAFIVAMRSLAVYCGSGGGSGGSDGAASGAGGNGGGALIIECAGAYNFTTTGGISVSGLAGASLTGNPAGAGGGGSAGMCLVLYNLLTANTGTVTATGGNGGSSSFTGSGSGGFGGGAGAGGYGGAGGAGGAAGGSGDGGNGSNAVGAGAGAGGAGGSGITHSATGGTGQTDSGAYLAVQNIYFT